MNEEMMAYVMLGIIISVIFNILYTRIKRLKQLIDERNRNESNIAYYVPDVAQARVPPPIPIAISPNNHQTNSNVRGRPPLPNKGGRKIRTPDTFPKCPQCGCRNRKGQTQYVFWDRSNNKWRCYNGHQFSS